MKVATLIAAFVVALTANAGAAELEQVSLQPYLLFSSHLEIVNSFEPTQLAREQQQQFITHGGAVFSSLSVQAGQQLPGSEVYRGVATPSQLLALRNGLNSARIRAQRSCEIHSTGSREGSIDFTWYNVIGRRNAFRVVLTRTGGSGLPPCGSAVTQILRHLRRFEAEILQNPDTEVHRTPP